MNRKWAETARTVLAVDAVGETAQAAYRDGTGHSDTSGPPVTAVLPSRIRAGETGVTAPARFLGRPLVTVDGKDTDPAELVAAVLRRAADAVGCPDLSTVDVLVLTHPVGWTSTATSALRRAGELAGVPSARVQLQPVPVTVPAEATDKDGGGRESVVLGALDAAAVPSATGAGRRQLRSRRRSRRGLAVAAVVAVVALVAGGAAVLARSGTTGDGSAPEAQPVERLAAFVGERGTLDCRNLFTSVAVRTVVDAGLRPSLNPARDIGTATSDGATACAPVYRGGRLAAPEPQVDGITGTVSGTVTVGLRTYPDDGHVPGATVAGAEVADYRNWTLATREADNADGGTVRIRTASTTVPGHGTMVLFFPLGDAAAFRPVTGEPTEPDGALREVIDGFEGTNLPAVTGGDAGQGAGEDLLRDASGHYDCSLLYDRVSVTDLVDHGVRVPAAGDTVRLGSGDETAMATGATDGADRRSCVLLKVGQPVQVVTGAPDGLPGNPVTGADDLAGWEEYWAFAPVIAPVDATEDGYQSYNLRHCRTGDDCVTVMVFRDPQAYDGQGEDVRSAREPALSVARYLAGTDTVDDSAAGGVTGGAADSATSASPEQ